MAGNVETKHEMLRAGYKFIAQAKCKSCHASIEWWLTTNKKKIPFNPMPPSDNSLVTPHWATCPKADEFRGSNAAPSAAKPAAQATDRQKELETFQRKSNARVVVAIFDDGSAAAWRKGIPGEDLRHELITEANSVRNYLAHGEQTS